MIEAVLGGKSSGCEYREDILTSTVFGTIKYIKPDLALIPFIESAFLYNDNRTTLWQKMNSEGIELRCYREVEYIFWSYNPNYGEPDLILIFKNHIYGKEDFLLVVEAKFKFGKSGTEENDQLVRYFEAINKDNKSFLEEAISGFSGRKGYIVYLTESEAFSDISESLNILQEKYPEIEENIFHLRWHQLYVTLEKMEQYYSLYEKTIAKDLMLYLDKVGLRDFSGISLPDETLSATLMSQFPVFYEDGTLKKDKKIYFNQLIYLDLHYKNNIFWRDSE